MRILVVDDEPAVRDALERALRLDGYEVALASDGREAVRSQADAPPDAVVLDVLMPGLDGLEVCRRMRDAGDRTPVLMLTARDAGARPRRGARRRRRRLPGPSRSRSRSCWRALRALLRRSRLGATSARSLRFADLELDPGAPRGPPRRAG